MADQDLKDAQMKVSELENALQIWKTRAKTLEVEIPVIRVKNEKLLSQASKDKQLIEKLKVYSCHWQETNIMLYYLILLFNLILFFVPIGRVK